MPTDSSDRLRKAMDDDALMIRTEVLEAADKGASVILVMHSYGGMPGSQAVKGLSRRERQQQGRPGGVIHLVYLCAFLLPPGQATSDLFKQGLVPDIFTLHPDGSCTVQEPGRNLYGDLSEAGQAAWAALLKPKASAALLGKGPSHAGWLDVLCTYLFCTNDLAIPLAAQTHMVSQAIGMGADIRTVTCSSHHSPMLSRPDLVASLVEEAIAKSAAASP